MYEEPMRYINNAIAILKDKAIKNENLYQDKKYVKMAGNTIWNGVLVALEEKYPEIKAKSKSRPDVNDYRKVIATKNRTLLNQFNTAYETAHLSMGYDGNLGVYVAQQALECSKKIINWIYNK